MFALVPFTEIVTKLLRFGVEGGSVFVECGCGWGLFHGVCGVGRLGQRYFEDRVVRKVVAGVVTECFCCVSSKSCNIVADVTENGVTPPTTKLHDGRFVNIVGVQKHHEGTSNGVSSYVLRFDS